MVLKYNIILAGAAVAVSSLPSAHAQTPVASEQMPVTGSVPEVCALQEPNLSPGVQENFRGLSGNTLQIAELVDSTTLAAKAASAEIEFEAICNFPHRIRLESQNNGLWQTDGRQTNPVDGFAYALPYVVSLNWGDVLGNLNADANVRRISEQRFFVDRATAGQLRLRINIAAGASNVRANAPVLAGVYGDTLRIILEPR